MISKWKFCIPVWALALCCCWFTQAPAAVIDYSSGGFYYQSAATAVTSTDSQSGWSSLADGSATVYLTYPNPDNPTVSAYSRGGISFFNPLGTGHVAFGMTTDSSASSTEAGYMNASASITTQGQKGEPGYFLVINPSSGEHSGDPVTLNLNWSYLMLTGVDAGNASVTGASTDAMSITVNGTSIFSYGRVDLGPNGVSIDSRYISYQAHIGDIIGIFLGASANLEYTGVSGDLSGTSYQNVDLNVVPLPGAIWLLGGGLAALAGFRWRRRR